jgi:hypothetical protein
LHLWKIIKWWWWWLQRPPPPAGRCSFCPRLLDIKRRTQCGKCKKCICLNRQKNVYQSHTE